MAERVPLWTAIKAETGAASVLYPGSFTDISPSFVFSHVTYQDMDKRCPKFFQSPEVRAHIPGPANYCFLSGDYREPLDVAPVDLLISQFAGPISHYCKSYVKQGGYLLANNSHADAGLAATDSDWKFCGAVDGPRIRTEGLADYFHPKGEPVTRDEMIEKMKGITYTKTASNYLFRRN